MPNDTAQLQARMYRTEELGEATLADHRAIFGAVAAGDEAGIRQAMRGHLARVHRTLSGGG